MEKQRRIYASHYHYLVKRTPHGACFIQEVKITYSGPYCVRDAKKCLIMVRQLQCMIVS